jgi:2-haloalkanoic acid dehalogenase type II
MLKVIAFDVFGTVFDLSSVNRLEIKDYVSHIRGGVWEPLELPESWYTLPAHPDAKEGIERLRTKYQVVTLSNGPVRLLTRLSKHNNISWDMIIPIEMKKVYKPKAGAYYTVPELMGVLTSEVLMVTANKTFGDLEAASRCSMKPCLIRDPDGSYANIVELAEALGC